MTLPGSIYFTGNARRKFVEKGGERERARNKRAEDKHHGNI
jgi:hypothetical protein